MIQYQQHQKHCSSHMAKSPLLDQISKHPYAGADTSERFHHGHGNVAAADLLTNIHSYGNFQDFFTAANIAGNQNS